MMSYSVKNRVSDQETADKGTRKAANCCSTSSSGLKLYQAFIFSVPILFIFIILILFYWLYLRRRREDWSSLRMRTSNSMSIPQRSDDLSRCELGVRKELREMLPIVVFKESFSVKDTQCSVCLGDYQADERLQQLPACGHTFHMDCIDLWLITHATCPLCRQSLLADRHGETNSSTTSNVENIDGQAWNEDPQPSLQPSESGDGGNERAIPTVGARDMVDGPYNGVGTHQETLK